MDVGNLISVSSAFSKSSLNIWKFMVHILLKPGMENFEHYFANVWDECNCVVVWTFFGIAFLWDWNENWKYLEGWTLVNIWKESASYFTWVFEGIPFLALEELNLHSLAGCQLRATELLGTRPLRPSVVWSQTTQIRVPHGVSPITGVGADTPVLSAMCLHSLCLTRIRTKS